MNKKAIIMDVVIIIVLILIFTLGWLVGGEIETQSTIKECNDYWNNKISEQRIIPENNITEFDFKWNLST